MKLAPDIKTKEATEIVAEQKKEFRLGSQMRIPGLRFWKWNIKTMLLVENIEEQKLKSGTIDMQTESISHKLVVDPDCLYCQAINKKNALKKFGKQLLAIQKAIRKSQKR